MPRLNAVRDPKNGVVSCWVCTGAMILVDVVRLTMLRMNSRLADWIFMILILIWITISVVETVKYQKRKSKRQERNQ